MTTEPQARLTILDVGHGNAAVLEDGDDCYVFDGATGNTVIDFLSSRGIHTVAAVIVSHTDEDHLAGITTLLLNDQIIVNTIYVNGDGYQQSRAFMLFRRAIKWARENQSTRMAPAHSDLPGSLPLSRGRIEVLAPAPENSLSGPGTVDLEDRPISRNGSSVVLRVKWNERPLALFCGDLDFYGLTRLKQTGVDLHANILVFPHHGGQAGPGGTLEEFTEELAKLVEPEQIAFSFARRRFKNPRSPSLTTLLAVRPQARILCTQLSVACASALPSQPAAFQTTVVGVGARDVEACAGSVVLDLVTMGTHPGVDEHEEFISTFATTPLCRSCRPA